MANSIHKSDIKINPEAVAPVHEGGLVILDDTKGRVFSSGAAGADRADEVVLGSGGMGTDFPLVQQSPVDFEFEQD